MFGTRPFIVTNRIRQSLWTVRLWISYEGCRVLSHHHVVGFLSCICALWV